MSREELVFVIAELLKNARLPGVKRVSADGDNDSSEMIIDMDDGRSLVLRSRSLEDADL